MRLVLLALAERVQNGFVLVAIDGPGGSSKTTLTAGLAAALSLSGPGRTGVCRAAVRTAAGPRSSTATTSTVRCPRLSGCV